MKKPALLWTVALTPLILFTLCIVINATSDTRDPNNAADVMVDDLAIKFGEFKTGFVGGFKGPAAAFPYVLAFLGLMTIFHVVTRGRYFHISSTRSCFVPTKKNQPHLAVLILVVGLLGTVAAALSYRPSVAAVPAKDHARAKVEEMRGWIDQGDQDAKNGVFARQMRDRAAARDEAQQAATEKDRVHRELMGLPALLPARNFAVIFACPKCGKDQPINPNADRIDQEIAHLQVCNGIRR